jgi:hypothetical protein
VEAVEFSKIRLHQQDKAAPKGWLESDYVGDLPPAARTAASWTQRFSMDIGFESILLLSHRMSGGSGRGPVCAQHPHAKPASPKRDEARAETCYITG